MSKTAIVEVAEKNKGGIVSVMIDSVGTHFVRSVDIENPKEPISAFCYVSHDKKVESESPQGLIAGRAPRKKEGLVIPLAGEVFREIIEGLQNAGKQITQKAIADHCGIGQTDLSRYLKGSQMRMSEVELVAEYLGVTMEYVIDQAFFKIKEQAIKKNPVQKKKIEALAEGVSNIGMLPTQENRELQDGTEAIA